ncbi:MAG: hypothetical protein QXI22_09390 [Sulfolobales archaeon]
MWRYAITIKWEKPSIPSRASSYSGKTSMMPETPLIDSLTTSSGRDTLTNPIGLNMNSKSIPNISIQTQAYLLKTI